MPYFVLLTIADGDFLRNEQLYGPSIRVSGRGDRAQPPYRLDSEQFIFRGLSHFQILAFSHRAGVFTLSLTRILRFPISPVERSAFFFRYSTRAM